MKLRGYKMLIQELQDLIDKEKFQAIANERKRFAKWLSRQPTLNGQINRKDRDSLSHGYEPEGY